ncbi:hypothetical protein PLESTB_000642900 [Pleodorina starrii]|uniref:Uncharacterized protein n=1 Tax=Pleodorina starrii TaxID=330485 RepID=A0A9W6F162_9CHLO|nr:hypothetical protein PLESTM_001304200 [Pleodorina starrii]GLC52557.1 hypothetical protein PLESTB_000642900 [Pleodorina starrii]GLC71557.1 hypothetical protein PLESTF_001135100 [Pleodorina starrii]
MALRMDKEMILLPPTVAGQAQLNTLSLCAAISALIIFYSVAMPLFLIVGFWLLPFVEVARCVSLTPGPGLKECQEKDTQCEQVPPTCHENILFDLADAECSHACVERGCSTEITGDGFEVRSNDVYEPVCYECGCGCHRRHRSSSGNALQPAATPVSACPDPSQPTAASLDIVASSRPAAAAQDPLTPAFATPEPLPPPRPSPSPSPPPMPLLPPATPQQQPPHQPPAPPPDPPSEPPAVACYSSLLSPDKRQLPEAQRSPPATPTANPATASLSMSLAASSFEAAETAKIALLLTATSPNAKSRKDLVVSSAPSSRRSSFGYNQPPPRRAARGGTATATTNVSGISPSVSLSGSISRSSSVASEPVISATGVLGGNDLGKPSYMRGTAASRAKLMSATATREPSRLGCSVQLLSSASSSGSISRRALTGRSFRQAVKY